MDDHTFPRLRERSRERPVQPRAAPVPVRLATLVLLLAVSCIVAGVLFAAIGDPGLAQPFLLAGAGAAALVLLTAAR